MRRSRHPMTASHIQFIHNPAAGKYEITEHGITYSMDLEETRLVKQFYRGN
jgi:hypothetical protein